VDGAARLAAGAGLADSAVGLTALALATTAELFALVAAAARRGVPEIAVAALVGSAAYNATVSLGLAAAVRPLEVQGVLPAAAVAAALPLAVVAAGARGRLGRPAGLVLALGYGAYVTAVLAG
jgi:cation:H+ antiporter